MKTVQETRMLETEGNEENKEDNPWNLVLVILFDQGTSLSRRLRTSSFPSFSSVDRFSLLFHSSPAQRPLGGAGSVRDLHPTVRRSGRRRRRTVFWSPAFTREDAVPA